jgi:hypothetical protein
MTRPDSVKWKLIRAQEHLDVLQAETALYHKTHPAKSGEKTGRFPRMSLLERSLRLSAPA